MEVVALSKTARDLGSPESYRPFSLCSNISKLLERLVNARLFWFLSNNRLIDSCQAGFWWGRQPVDSVLQLIKEITGCFHTKVTTYVLSFDLKQAYYKVWRSKLILKLRQMGVCKNMYR